MAEEFKEIAIVKSLKIGELVLFSDGFVMFRMGGVYMDPAHAAVFNDHKDIIQAQSMISRWRKENLDVSSSED